MKELEHPPQRPTRPPAQFSMGSSLEDILQMSGDPTTAIETKSCCAVLYQLDPVRLLLGDTLHPGGLDLTERLCRLVGVKRDGLVLDVACGPGTGTLAMARSFECRAVGVDLGHAAITEASGRAIESMVQGRVSFLCGDAEGLPFRSECFDAVLCECSMSLFPDKEKGVQEMVRLLRPGGKLGVSDVTVESGCLPEELKGGWGRMLCLADAPPVGGYRELMDTSELDLLHEEEASHSMLGLLGEIEGKLAAFGLFLGPKAGEASSIVSRALPVIQEVKELVRNGAIGYRLFVAEKRV